MTLTTYIILLLILLALGIFVSVRSRSAARRHQRLTEVPNSKIGLHGSQPPATAQSEHNQPPAPSSPDAPHRPTQRSAELGERGSQESSQGVVTGRDILDRFPIDSAAALGGVQQPSPAALGANSSAASLGASKPHVSSPKPIKRVVKKSAPKKKPAKKVKK